MNRLPERWIIILPRCLPAGKFPTFASGRQGRGAILRNLAPPPELTLRRLWPDQFEDLVLLSISGFNYCPVRQRHGIERFIGSGLLKRNQPETERRNLEFKIHNLKRPVPVEVHCPVQRQFNELLARDLPFDALSIRFEAICVSSVRVAKQDVGFRRVDCQ